MTSFEVILGDVKEVPSDLLLLKFAQNFYGADEAVASELVSKGICHTSEIQPGPWNYTIVETKGVINPKSVLFLGTPPLLRFGYSEMIVFARTAIEIITKLGIYVRKMTTTVHGSYGLDSGESLQRLVQGFREGLSLHRSTAIERITFLTLGERYKRLLSYALDELSLNDKVLKNENAQLKQKSNKQELNTVSTSISSIHEILTKKTEPLLPLSKARKKKVFVAMPYSEEFENVYEFGIYPGVRNCDLICERVDETHFTGDILDRIRTGIEGADLVIAELSKSRPNVYLEVGYAWGRGIPVIFIARKGEKLHFDVSTQRCIFYGKFTQLAKELEELIKGIIVTK